MDMKEHISNWDALTDDQKKIAEENRYQTAWTV